MKSLIRHLILSFLLLFSLLTLVLADDAQKGVLWKVELAGTVPSYVFGTIHSEDARVVNLPTDVEERFEEADRVVLEMVVDFSTMLQSAGAMFLKTGETLDMLLSKEDYGEIISALRKYGMPEEAAKKLKPWAIMSIISMPKARTGEFLDFMLYQKAKKLQIKVYGLEKPEEQLAIFEAIPLSEQVILLKETLKEVEQIPVLLEKMLQVYLERDLPKLLSIYQESLQKSQTQTVIQTFSKRILQDRNIKMVKRIKKHLQAGNAFIAVGALHLPGEDGILNLLQKQGYQVTPIH